jgi:hypothetical protein
LARLLATSNSEEASIGKRKKTTRKLKPKPNPNPIPITKPELILILKPKTKTNPISKPKQTKPKLNDVTLEDVATGKDLLLSRVASNSRTLR